MQALEMLETLGLPEDLIADVRSMLNERAEALEAVKPTPIGEVFGGSPAGSQLSHHAALARQHVADAVLQMAAGLRGFREELGSHEARMDYTDTQSAVDLKKIEEAAACVAPADFSANNQCTLPTAGGDD
ncbi:hypothetical protein [Nocardioides sp. SR21]|uniref:hypothetical protein n=1 Tax=Nocardioides sp. SR21 TaxID=2919501 RepID=UPI001FAA6C12|nr:hypothetical protein [Nocardioides sp. SR21]